MNVFPVRPGSKVPAITGWQTSVRLLEMWPAVERGINRWGAPAGPVNGWWVLDVDIRHGGDLSLALLCDQHPGFSEMLDRAHCVMTPSGGFHYYFKWSALCAGIKNTAGKLGPGLDIRTEGGYVLVPPTAGYVARRDSAGGLILEDAPAWLLEKLGGGFAGPAKPKAGSSGEEPIRDTFNYAARAMASAIEEVQTAADGTRDHTMNRNAYNLGRLIEPCGLDRDKVVDEFITACIEAGYTPHKVTDCVNRAVDAGMQNPREVAPTVAGPTNGAKAPDTATASPPPDLEPMPPKPGGGPPTVNSTPATIEAWKKYRHWQKRLRDACEARLVLIQYDQSRVLYERLEPRRVAVLGSIDVQAGAVTRIGQQVGLLVPPAVAHAMVDAFKVQAHAERDNPSLYDSGTGLYRWPEPKVEAGPMPTWDAFLARLSDPEAFLCHVWSAFEPKFVGRQALWLQGEGNDGKTIALKAIFEATIGTHGIAVANDDDLLRGSQFLFATMWDKPAVLIGDSKSINLMMQGMLHRLTGRDYIGVEYKNGPRFTAAFQGVVWVTSNQQPNIEANASNLSRLSLITISGGGWVTDLAAKLRGEVPALLARARDAYQIGCKNNFAIDLNDESRRLLDEATGHESDKCAAVLKVGGFVLAEGQWTSRTDLLSRLHLNAAEMKSFYAWLRRQKGVVECKRDGMRGFSGVRS
jgi:hypothetical protein